MSDSELEVAASGGAEAPAAPAATAGGDATAGSRSEATGASSEDASASEDLAIAFRAVSFSYDGEHTVLDHVSLSVARGSYVVVLGHNGSGKSTLARHMNALLTPDEGQVLVMGMDTADLDAQIEIRRHAGMVFQNPDNQMVTSIVADDVAFGPENLGIPQPEIVARVDKALADVAMTEFAQADPTELSGGQKQRVSIAGMLAMEPDILVFDEPCAMLDPRGRRGVRRVMRELNARGMTIVHITHFMEDALEADVIHVMDHGRVVLSGTPEEVFAHGARLRELGLAQPFAMRLAVRLRALGVDAPDTPYLDRLEDALCDETTDRIVCLTSCGAGAKDETNDTVGCLPRAVAPASGEAALVFDHVTYHYDSEVVGAALSDVCLEVASGEFVGIIGHTGSGKSTLAEHCNGAKLPSSGTVRVNGIPTSDKRRRHELRRHVGFVAQYPEYQLFAETVREDVGFGPRNLGMDDAEVDAAVREALDMVGLPYDEVAEVSPFDLSGGQKRRVALAGIIAMHPGVLALDEPMVGLDPRGRREVFDIVRRLHEGGTTIVMVSHSMEDMAEAAQRIVVLDRGRVVDEGDPALVFSHGELLHRVGLDVPLPARVAADLEARGWDFGEDHPLTIDDLAREIAEEVRP